MMLCLYQGCQRDSSLCSNLVSGSSAWMRMIGRCVGGSSFIHMAAVRVRIGNCSCGRFDVEVVYGSVTTCAWASASGSTVWRLWNCISGS